MLAQVSRRRALDWFLPVTLGFFSAAVVAVGFYLALTANFGERLGPPPAAAAERGWGTGGFRIVALGDSITDGTGDAPDRGYVGRLIEELRDRGRRVSLNNFAEGGDETADLLQKLDAPATLQRVGEAQLILMSIGGNDLSHALRGRRLDEDPNANPLEVGPALDRASKNLAQILTRVRAANPNAPIRLIGLYNPFEVLPSAEAEVRAQLLAWNSALERATFPFKDVLVVPVADLFADRPDRLAGDRFHPGARGHELIADRLLDTLKDER
jgi:lysophospholipase L1-like esterase